MYNGFDWSTVQDYCLVMGIKNHKFKLVWHMVPLNIYVTITDSKMAIFFFKFLSTR